MKKALFLILCTLTLMAKTDFSEMSTEELIALLGYVEPQKEERFLKELTRREESMSEEQKALYEAWKRQKSEE